MKASHVDLYVVAVTVSALFIQTHTQALLPNPFRYRKTGHQPAPIPLLGASDRGRRLQGTLPSLLDKCCETGEEWFSISRERCSLHPGPFEGVGQEDTMACQAVVEVCCLKMKAQKQCTQGKQIARIRQSCDALHSQLGKAHARECCSCCKLGQVAQRTAIPCTFLGAQPDYTEACKSTFEECCIGDRPTTTTTEEPQAHSRLDNLNECERFSNQLCAHLCIDTPSSYRCACHAGFTLQADGRTCKQNIVDRCQINNPCQHTCVDTGVAITCKCLDGFILKPDGRTCEDEDECKIGTHNCQHGQTCKNTAGAFACEGISRPSPSTCPRGYVYNGVSKSCEDLDECRLTPGLCSGHQMCVNTGGSYTCIGRSPNDPTACDPGFNFNIRTHSCEDINECVLNQNTCLEGQNCENTVGSYVCRRGISCGTGYTLDTSSQTCKDDNECELGTHNCGLGRECQNSQGSFRCVTKRCPSGSRLDFNTGQCQTVVCPKGLRADRAGNCIDINECSETPTVCRSSQQCFNTIGSYSCRNNMNCGQGYEINEQGNGCLDINECEAGTHDCTGPLQTCINRRGTYMCGCPDGYRTNHAAHRCDDIDECSRYGGQVCSPNSKCVNTPGSFNCVCNDGFEAEGEGRTCRDVDECVTQPAACQHTCRNTWGSFHCACEKGYQLTPDQRTCEDINECEQWADRGLCAGHCQNTPGSFTCSCPEGYSMMQDGRTCQDIDECALRTADCRGTDKLCINTRGGFKCEMIACPKGFVRAPSLGNANNNIRCQRQTFVCAQGDTECLFAPLSYSMNFITFPSHIQMPADLFTMRGPYSHYRRLEFDLKLVSAEDPVTGVSRTTRQFFNLRRVTSNEVVVRLMRLIEGPQDLELELAMKIYSKEFREEGGEVFFGTAVAKIKIYVTDDFKQ